MTPQEYADKFLYPYRTSGQKIIARFCPICNGGDNHDQDTFALYPDETGRWVYKCQRAGCPDGKGTYGHLLALKGLAKERPPKDGSHAFQFVAPKKTYSLPDVSSLAPPTEEIYTYFSLRKISRATVDAFRIKANERGEIVFPFYEDDVVVYVKTRKPQKYVKGCGYPKEMQERNTKPVLFGLDLTSYSEPLIITEGQIDCMSLYEAGIRNVVSVPCGANNEEWVDNNWAELEKYPSFILFGDGDAPGRNATSSWAHRLGEGKCSIVQDYPERPDKPDTRCKDANEILYFYGADKLREMLSDATEVTMEGLVALSSVPMFSPVQSKLIKSSFFTVNYELGGYSPGDLVCWTGRTGAGKSTAVSQEILMSVNEGERVAWYTAELAPAKLKRSLYLQAAGSEYIGLQYEPRRDRELPYISPAVVSRIDEWLGDKIMLCTDNVATMMFDTDYLVDLLRYARSRKGCTVAVVDNIMTAVMGADDEHYFRAQEKFTLELKKLATSLGMVIHLVAHPRKSKDNLTNDDVSGSASITRLADTVLAVGHGVLKVLKNRNDGVTDVVSQFTYLPDCRLCVDCRRPDPLHCSWNRDGIDPPDRLANEVYRPVYPEVDYAC